MSLSNNWMMGSLELKRSYPRVAAAAAAATRTISSILELNNRLSGQLGPDAQGHFLAQDLGANAQLVLPTGYYLVNKRSYTHKFKPSERCSPNQTLHLNRIPDIKALSLF
ncbi:hypothetical protein DPMN_193397 [Dreissena polymorpha]|uniref:Uncharacterized protein n=1 Tax=Dreissena polymorpha TaxID=45954 RepID=A0A9D3Y6C0_DREPO|nr:hypothetical protein DPMN_193397 [Dreissena polymorpha]